MQPPDAACPELSSASTITVASEIAAITLLRSGKLERRTSRPSGNGDISRWSRQMVSWSGPLSTGDALDNGVPMTAIARPPL